MCRPCCVKSYSKLYCLFRIASLIIRCSSNTHTNLVGRFIWRWYGWVRTIRWSTTYDHFSILCDKSFANLCDNKPWVKPCGGNSNRHTPRIRGVTLCSKKRNILAKADKIENKRNNPGSRRHITPLFEHYWSIISVLFWKFIKIRSYVFSNVGNRDHPTTTHTHPRPTLHPLNI